MKIVIRAGTLIDGVTSSPQRDMALLIEGERVVRVAEWNALGRSDLREVEVVDLSDSTVLPGLIDAHTHIAQDASPDPTTGSRQWGEADTMARGVRFARDTVLAGITTIRNLGTSHDADIVLARVISEGLVPGPRIIASGRVITPTGGHGHYMGWETDGPAEMRKAVRRQLKAGAGVIKLMATGGVMTPGVKPGAPQFDLDEIQTAVHEAAKKGRRVAVHAEGIEGIRDSIAAGVASIEHGYFIDNEEALEQMKAKGIYLVPTLIAYVMIAEPGVEAGIPAEAAENAQNTVRTNQESFRMAVEAGVPIAMGSDAGTAFNNHGKNAREIEYMVRCGQDPMAAIQSATRNGAMLLGLGDDLGTLEPGKIADLIAVHGDPIADITVLQHVHSVWQSGRAVKLRGQALV